MLDNINEGLEQNDLARLIHPELHIDEYKSKMGKDEDIVVLSFKVTGREPAAADNVMAMMKDILNLTSQVMGEWSVQIRSRPEKLELTADNIRNNVPLSTGSYEAQYGKKGLDEMRTAAGVAVTTRAPVNDHTQTIRSLAGIL